MKFPCGICEKTVEPATVFFTDSEMLYTVVGAVKGVIFLAITLLDIVTDNCKRTRHLGTVRSA